MKPHNPDRHSITITLNTHEIETLVQLGIQAILKGQNHSFDKCMYTSSSNKSDGCLTYVWRGHHND